MAKKFDIQYYFSEGFHSIFTHGFMSFAAVCMIVACLLIMGSFTLVAVNANELLADLEQENEILAYVDHSYTDAQAQRNILSNPFKRFEDMQMLHHTKTLGVIQVDESVWKKLTREGKQEIERICDEKLAQYYGRVSNLQLNKINVIALREGDRNDSI